MIYVHKKKIITILIKDFNYLSNTHPQKCCCKFRYRQQDIDCQVEYLEDNQIKVHYENAKAVTPGQFCVLYNGGECIGGGIIDKVYK